MHEQEDVGLWAILLQSIYTVTVILKILEGFSGLNVKNINQHRDVLKYRRSLGGKIAVHKRVLTTAVPKVEDQVTEEPDMILFHIDGCTESRGQRRRVIRAGRGVCFGFGRRGMISWERRTI